MLVTQEKYWTPKEIADHFSVSEETVRRYVRTKQLRAIRFGGNVRIPDGALREFIEKQNSSQNKK
jgi:excisionase family DNA binding protein